MADIGRPSRKWSFNVRTLLVALAAVSCVLGLWRWYTNRSLNALAEQLGGNREQVKRLVFHPRFASSGLKARILEASHGGILFVKFGSTQNSGQLTCFVLSDFSTYDLLLVTTQADPNCLTWSEVSSWGNATHEFVPTRDATHLVVREDIEPYGRFRQRVFRMMPNKIQLIEESEHPPQGPIELSHGNPVEVRAWLSPGGPNVPGPESDLQ